MTQHNNYAVQVLQRATSIPDSVALLAPNQTMSYAALRDRIIFYALHMRLRGIGRHSVVALDANQMPEGPALGLAAALLGARWLELKSASALTGIEVTHILSVNPAASGPNVYVVDANWTAYPAGLKPNEPIRFDGFTSEDEIAFYVESSGTTGRPKLIARPYRNAWPSIDKMRPVGFPKVYSQFPPLSSAGFAFRVAAFLEGATVIVRDPDLKGLIDDGVRIIQASPAQADLLCESASAPANRIPRLILWGAQVPPRLVRRFLDYFEEVELGYGAREVGGVGRMPVRQMPPDGIVEYRIVEGAVVEVVDLAGRACAPDVAGMVRIKTGQLADGYVGSPPGTEQAFRDGWFYPGDLGSMSADGKLRILGRLGDVLNFGGVKANATDIDEAACSAPGAMRAVSFSRPSSNGVDELCIAAVLSVNHEPKDVASAIRERCRAALGPSLVVTSVFFPEDLPLNESGKEVRGALRAACEALIAF